MLLPSNWLAHSPGNFSFLRGFNPTGRSRRLTLGKPAPQADAFGVEPDLFAGDLHGRQIAGGFLRRIAAGRLPNFPGVVIVGDAARRHSQVEHAGHQRVVGQRQVPRVAGQQPALPVRDALAGVHFVTFLGVAEQRQLRVAAVDQVGVRHQVAGTVRSGIADTGIRW